MEERQRLTPRLQRLDLLLSIPSLLFGFLFAAGAVTIFTVFQGSQLTSTKGCPIRTLFALLLVNGLLDFALRVLSFGAKLGRELKSRQHNHSRHRAGRTFWGMLDMSRAAMSCASFMLMLVWLILLFSSTACAASYPAAYTAIQVYIYTFLIVNLLGSCISCCCMAVEQMNTRRQVLIFEQQDMQRNANEREYGMEQLHSPHGAESYHQQDRLSNVFRSENNEPTIIIRRGDGDEHHMPVSRQQDPNQFDHTVTNIMNTFPQSADNPQQPQPYRVRNVEMRNPFANVMNVLLGPPDASRVAPPLVLIRDGRGRIRAAPPELLEQLATEILTHYQGPHGAPPTSHSALQDLPRRTVQPEDLEKEETCPICFEEYKLEDGIISLPCHHEFHTDCVLPWLREHNGCPICRYELPTDDSEYERQRAEREAEQESSNSRS